MLLVFNLINLIFCGCLQFLDASSARCRIKFDIDICMSNSTQDIVQGDCMKNVSLCGRNLSIAYIQVEPYSTQILYDLIQRCCGACSESNVNEISLQDVSEIPDRESNSVDFVFPVLGEMTRKKMFGYHFIPLIHPPSLYYFTAKDRHLLSKMVVHCFGLWPLILISTFFIALSGFLIWLIERKNNPGHFPPSFAAGWMSGCWWSFISMTTVGYGDKVPRSGVGRCFSSIWILIGITTFSLITAMLASHLTVTNSHRQTEMAGHRIGVLKHRIHDTTAVVVHGGIATSSSTPGKEGIPELIQMLTEKKINGFVLDLYILIKFHRYTKKSNIYRKDFEFLHTETVRGQMISSTPEKLSYGILVKELEDFEYLHDFILDNYQVISTCNGHMLNSHSHEISHNEIQNPLFSPDGHIFWPSFITGCIVIACILCFGAIHDSRRRRKQSNNSTGHVECARSVIAKMKQSGAVDRQVAL